MSSANAVVVKTTQKANIKVDRHISLSSGHHNRHGQSGLWDSRGHSDGTDSHVHIWLGIETVQDNNIALCVEGHSGPEKGVVSSPSVFREADEITPSQKPE